MYAKGKIEEREIWAGSLVGEGIKVFSESGLTYLLSGGHKIAKHYINGKLKFVVMNLK